MILWESILVSDMIFWEWLQAWMLGLQCCLHLSLPSPWRYLISKSDRNFLLVFFFLDRTLCVYLILESIKSSLRLKFSCKWDELLYIDLLMGINLAIIDKWLSCFWRWCSPCLCYYNSIQALMLLMLFVARGFRWIIWIIQMQNQRFKKKSKEEKRG